MNIKTFTNLLLLTGIFFLVSCGGNNSPEAKQPTKDTVAAPSAAPPAPPVSTIITRPENILVVTHKVKSYDKWKMAYDAHDSVRKAFGLHNYVIGRGVKDTNVILVAVKVDDTGRVAAFSKDPSLKASMAKGGVIGKPEIHLVTVVYQDTATNSSKLRSRVTFAVKDWDNFQKNLKDGEQERADNGIILRTYGHETSDPRKVTVVTAILDSAKAMAYFSSDMLKKRMDAGGVISKPNRFIYRVVMRY